MAKSELQFAGEFRLEDCRIVSTTGNVYNITELVEQIEIFEDIWKSAISGNIIIKDTTNIVENFPIIGEERFLLKLSTPQANPTPESIIDYTTIPLMIYRVNVKEKVQDGAQVVSLNFGSIEGFRNDTCRVSQSYKGQPSEIVERILRDESYLRSPKKLFKEDTANLVKVVFPNKKPWACVKHLTNISNSKKHGDSPTYMFYETTKGFHFRTFDGLCNTKPKMFFKENTPMLTPAGIMDVRKTMETLVNFQIVSSKDTIKNMHTGMLCSKLLTHDVYSKKINTFKYNYLENFNKDIYPDGDESGPIISTSPDPETGKRLTEHEDTKLFVASTSNGYAFSEQQVNTDIHEYPYQSDNLEQTLQRKNSRLLQMTGGIVINIEIHGNTFLQVGDKIHLEIEANSTLNKKRTDLELTGNYIITRLKHQFLRSGELKHTILMQVVKFSTRNSYSSGGMSNYGLGTESAELVHRAPSESTNETTQNGPH